MSSVNHAVSSTESGQRRLLWAVLILVLVLIALLPATPLLYHTPNTDSAIFHYIGDKIRLGELPFRDVYDHKPPLIFYLNALGLFLGQGSRWGVWAIEFISLSAAGLLGFAFLRRYFGTLAGLLGMGAMLLNLAFVHDRGNLTEEYALPFQFAALFLLSGVERSGRGGWRLFFIGVMLSMASTLKQPLAGIGLSIAVYLAWFYLSRRDVRGLILAGLRVGLGFAVVWLVWFVYFAAVGIFSEFWEAAFAYNVALSGITLERRIQALFSAMDGLIHTSGYFLGGMVAWLAAFPLLFWQRSADSPAERPNLTLPLLVALVDLPVEIGLSSLSGNNFAHYFMMLLPATTILIAFAAYALPRLANPAAGKAMPFVWLGLLMLPVFAPGIYETSDRIGPRGDRQIEAVVEYVIANTQPEDKVLQWGIAAQINPMSGRDTPTRYFFTDPLFVEGYSGRQHSETLLRELQAAPPVLIVDQGMVNLPLIYTSDIEQCHRVRDPEYYYSVLIPRKKIEDTIPTMPAGMDEVYHWICQNYVSVGPVGELGWNVYRLRGN